jgi:type II secretory ATPase GspE/PulE/Tfp pilus assembly ATPase PilB-like protein
LEEKVQLPEKIKTVVGCEKCGNTGYLGRAGLYEIVEVTEQIREMILQRKSANEIKHVAREHSFSVFESGVIQVIQGNTTLEEVIRVSKMNE